MALIYKILTQALWAQACKSGQLRGAPVDLADGYIHFSTREQLAETAAKHFAGQHDLRLLAIETDRLPDAAALKWEPSRGGALFPHLYGALPISAVVSNWPLPWAGDQHRFPQLEQD